MAPISGIDFCVNAGERRRLALIGGHTERRVALEQFGGTIAFTY
jgi:hypothetical protein